jgi:integrase
MANLRLRYVQSFVDRKSGAVFHYFRKRGHRRVRLPGQPGSAEFMAAYQQTLAASPLPIGAEKRSKPGSVSVAIAEYYGSQAFRSLTGGTPAQRRSILERFREQHGHLPLASLPKESVVTLLDTMQPNTARLWLRALRHLAHWAEQRKLIKSDPTWGIKIKPPKSDGHHTWTEAEIAQFEATHPIGSKARLALALGLYTAQRRADVIGMGRQHFRDGVLVLRPKKTKNTTGITLTIPVHTDLAKIIAVTPTGHLTLLVTRFGRSYRDNNFSDQFRVWCTDAGLPQHCTFHGLRKAACRRLAQAGCTAHEIMAISGHASLREVERYTKAVDQVRLARAAMAKTAATGR